MLTRAYSDLCVSQCTTQRGFTLLELLIALSIFALISAMAYGGMNSVMQQRAWTEQKADQLKQLQMAYTIMERDFSQMVDRGIRNEYGSEVGALVGGGSSSGVELSRLGHANPAGFRRSDVQRVRYLSEDGKLFRYSWKVLDRAPDSEAYKQVMIDETTEFALRYLDTSSRWQENWPPIAQTGQLTAGLPRAVEVRLETKNFGQLVWLFRLPEPYQPSKQVPSAGGGNRGGQNNNNRGGGNLRPPAAR